MQVMEINTAHDEMESFSINIISKHNHRQYCTLILADRFDNAAMQDGHVSHLTENFTLTTFINSARMRQSHRQMQIRRQYRNARYLIILR